MAGKPSRPAMTTEERNALVEQYLPTIRKIAKGVIAAHCASGGLDLDDVVQEVALRMMTRGWNYQRWRGVTLETYLQSIIKNHAIDYIRNSARFRHEEVFSEPAVAPPVWMLCQDRARLKKLLTKKQLQAVELVYVYGFTHEQAAKKLGIHRVKISERLRRALFRLKKSEIQTGTKYPT